jgi:hypothetical protein
MTRDEWKRYLARERAARYRARKTQKRIATLPPDEAEKVSRRANAGRRSQARRRKPKGQ